MHGIWGCYQCSTCHEGARSLVDSCFRHGQLPSVAAQSSLLAGSSHELAWIRLIGSLLYKYGAQRARHWGLRLTHSKHADCASLQYAISLAPLKLSNLHLFLADALSPAGERPQRAAQLWRWTYRHDRLLRNMDDCEGQTDAFSPSYRQGWLLLLLLLLLLLCDCRNGVVLCWT